MRELKLSYPEDRKVEILTKDQELCHKAKIANDKREKDGKFHQITNGFKTYSIFIPFGKDVQKTIEKHIKNYMLC